LNDAPGEFDVIGWVEATVGGERPQHEGGGIGGGDEKGADQEDGNKRHDRTHGILLQHREEQDLHALFVHDGFQGHVLEEL